MYYYVNILSPFTDFYKAQYMALINGYYYVYVLFPLSQSKGYFTNNLN
jgi:hypothetical protein